MFHGPDAPVRMPDDARVVLRPPAGRLRV